MSVKMAAFAPMPKASESMATPVNSGERRNMRMAYRRSRPGMPMQVILRRTGRVTSAGLLFPDGVGGLVAQFLRQSVHQAREGLHPGEVLVVPLYKIPRTGAGAGFHQHLLHGIFVEPPLFAVAPVILRQLPRLVVDAPAFFDTAKLFLRGDMKPKLDQNRSEIAQLALERIDLLVGALPFLVSRIPFHAFYQHAPVPGAIEDGDLPSFGDAHPEAVKVMFRLLLAQRHADRIDNIPARVHLFGDAFDGPALPCGIPSFESNDDRSLLAVNFPGEFTQLNLAPRQLLDIPLARQGERKVQAFKHPEAPVRRRCPLQCEYPHPRRRRIRRLRAAAPDLPDAVPVPR